MVVGILADPEAAPVEVARLLEEELGGRLATRLDGGRRWDVQVRYARLPASEFGSHEEMIAYGDLRRQTEGWDLVVCVTDLPLQDGGRSLVADLAADRGLALISLPGLGAARLHRRVTEMVVELVADLATRTGRDVPAPDQTALGDASLRRPFYVVVPDTEGIDARVLARRGRSRLVLGMVRDNRPWRLVAGLRGAIAAAFAFAAFWLISPTVWQLGVAHGPWRAGGIALATIVALVVWLIIYHRLWLSTSRRDETQREQAVLFNASTVITLLIGVSCAFTGLIAINFLAANLVITQDVLGEHLQRPVGLADYVRLTWLVTSGAAVAGALGTGFDSEESVREAAYSRREQQRRAQLDEEQDTGGEPPDEDAGRPS